MYAIRSYYGGVPGDAETIAVQRLLPLTLFSDPAIRIGVISALFMGGALFGFIAYTPVITSYSIHYT